MILQSREAREFCIEILLAIEPAVNSTPRARREINHCKIAFSHHLVNRPVGFSKQIAQFDVCPFRSYAGQAIANSARGAVVTLPETRRENEDSFFHQARRARSRVIS